MRFTGTLRSGKPSAINFASLFDVMYEKSAHFVMKNTAALKSEEFEEIKVSAESVEETENAIIREHLSKIKIDDMPPEKEYELTKQLLSSLNKEKEEGETTATFEKRVKDDVKQILNVEL